MPLFLDLHDLPEGITPAHVAEMHQADLDLEHKYDCRGLTYWCDEKRKTAFCLIEAPNKEALIELHQNAHGAIPTQIIEVNGTIVESFLGRIEDPEKAQDVRLNIINDPAFRILVVVKLVAPSISLEGIKWLKAHLSISRGIIKTLANEYKGNVVKLAAKDSSTLLSFESVTAALHCCLKIQREIAQKDIPLSLLNIGISAGTPVTNRDSIFEDTIKLSHYLNNIVQGGIAISPVVKDLYESENQNKPFLNNDSLRVLTVKEESFLMDLMNYMESIWTQTEIDVSDFEENLGLSKSNLYRTMIKVIGKSPNTFLRHYRLEKALHLITEKELTISEIAYQTGFSSPAYFSKCFQKHYNILPSQYKIVN